MVKKVLILILILASLVYARSRCATTTAPTGNGRTRSSRLPNEAPWTDDYILADGNNPFTSDVNLGGNFITNTGYTESSVLFIDPNGDITEDNANFYWDDVNNVLYAYTLISASGTPLYNIVEDTSPQLGGDLDVNDWDIINASGVVNIKPSDTIPYLEISRSGSLLRLKSVGEASVDLILGAEDDICTQPSGDDDDYFRFYTTDNIPHIESFGTCDFHLVSSGGTFDFDNDIIKTTGKFLGGDGGDGRDVETPTYSFINDQNTGAYLIASGRYGIATTGAGPVYVRAEFSENWAKFFVPIYLSGTEIVGIDGEVNKSVVEDSGNWDAAYTERGSQIAGTDLTWDGSELDVDNVFVRKDGTEDLTGNWTISANDVNLTAGTIAAARGVIHQTADGVRFGGDSDEGFRVFGYDDKSASNIQLVLDQDGNVHIRSTGNIGLLPGGRTTAVGTFSTDKFQFNSNADFQFGSSSTKNAKMRWSTGQTNAALMIGLSSYTGAGKATRTVIICDVEDMTYNFAHPIPLNPTLFIQSEARSATEWMSFAHDGNDGVIDVGAGILNLPATKIVGFHSAITTKTDTNYTLTVNDDTVLFDTGATTRTATLPAASTVTGKIYHIKKIDSGAGFVTIDGNGSETIDGDLTPDITAQYESFTIVCDGSNWHVI